MNKTCRMLLQMRRLRRLGLFCLFLLVVFLYVFLYDTITHKRDIFTINQSRNYNLREPIVVATRTQQTVAKQQNKRFAKQTLWVNPNDNIRFFTQRDSIPNPLNHRIIYGDDIDCSTDPPFLTVLVLSIHTNGDFRKSIRETWGGLWPRVNVTEKVKVVFLLATNDNATLNAAVKKEGNQTHDIVMFDFRESYFNLTYKVLMGLKWVKDVCPQTKYVMKVDEDTFVNIPKALELLRLPEWNSKIVGPYFHKGDVYRSGKFAVEPLAFPFKRYPPHVKGNIYFMPTIIAMRLLNVSCYLPYVNMEDAHVTGILAKAVGGISYKNIIGKLYATMHAFKGCDFLKGDRLASQYIYPDLARDIWQKMEKNSCYKQT